MERTESGALGQVATAQGDGDIPPQMREAASFVLDMGGADLLQKIITLFSSTSVERIHELRAAAAAGDRDRVRRFANAMKGSAAQVGAECLRDAAATLESTAATQLPAELVSGVEALQIHVERACTLLQLAKALPATGSQAA